MTPKLVIFDCDGVLVETESITLPILADFFIGHGAAIAPGDVHDLFVGGTIQTAGAEAERLGAALPDGWMALIYGRIFDRLRAGVDVFDGLFTLLDLLEAQGIAVAVASNGPMAKMEISLGPSGLWDRLEGRIYSGHEHGAPKPAPDLLLHAAKAAGVAPDQAVMVDDTMAGARAAKAAGMRAIGFAAASDPAPLRTAGVPVALTMAEVTELLGLAKIGV